MPAKTEKQQVTACMALAMKKGKMSHSRSKTAHEMMMSMSMEELEKLCRMPSMQGGEK